MKKVLIYSILFFSLAACNESLETVNNELQPDERKTLLQKLQERNDKNGSHESAMLIETITPVMIYSNSLKKGKYKGGNDGSDGECGGACCCDCEGTLNLSLPTNPEGCNYFLELWASCSPDLDYAYSKLIYDWTNSFDPDFEWDTSSVINFDILDEHYYFIVAKIKDPVTNESCEIEASFSDTAGGIHNFTLTDEELTGNGGITIAMLHCDRVSYSECWNGPVNNPAGGPRDCCLEF